MLITFEGVEGAGKTTQINNLKTYLVNKGFNTIITRQPGGSILGGKIRSLILDPDQEDKPSNLAELLLYIADRAHHVETIIEPALAKNIIVLCDRYIDSTIAYQGYARGNDLEKLAYLNSIATKDLKPDLTIVMDLDPEIGLKRAHKRNNAQLDRIELEKIDFHKKVRNGFLEIAQKEPHRVKVVDASKSEEAISIIIIDLVLNFLLLR